MTFRAANEFRIFAHGDDFDVDSYLTTSTLHPDHVRRRRPQGLRTTGVAFALGDGLSLRIFDQEKIAIAYLKEHKNELLALARHSGVETFILGLQYVCRVAKPHDGFCLSHSVELLWHALEIGVRPVFYVTLDRTQEDSPAVPESWI
jgi:hypothetical protein